MRSHRETQIMTGRRLVNCLSRWDPCLGILYGVLLTFALVGCAETANLRQTKQSQLAWMTFFNGLDLRADCAPGAPDRLRLVFRDEDEKAFTVFELLRLARVNRAFSSQSTIPLESLSKGPPWEIIRAGATPGDAFSEISLRHFAIVVYWLERNGVFRDTESGLVLRTIGSFDWIATGCLRGGWFSSSADAEMTQRIATRTPVRPTLP